MSQSRTDAAILSVAGTALGRKELTAPSLPVAPRNPLVRFELRVAERARRLGIPGVAGIVALLSCAAFVQSTLLPQRAHVRELRAVAESATASPVSARVPGPVRPAADTFIASLPDRDALPGILAAIVQQAQSAGLALDRGAYQWSAEKSGAVARYQLTLPVSGSYPAVRRFVDTTLAAVPAAALAGISLERANVGDGNVNANLRFEVFVRNTP